MIKTNENPIEKPAVASKPKSEVKTLDDLLEILEKDDLRHVVGGAASRPKGRP